jgi:hypothetical protein
MSPGRRADPAIVDVQPQTNHPAKSPRLNGVLREMENAAAALSEKSRCKLTSLRTFPIEADTACSKQIVMNLAVNARDAMPKGGQLFIGTSTRRLMKLMSASAVDSRAGKFVVRPSRILVAAWTPIRCSGSLSRFFPQRSWQRTGLGLATVYGIVKQHQGWIEVNSQQRGQRLRSTFLLLRPTVRAVEPITSHEPSVAARDDLLVEDEPVLRGTCSRGVSDMTTTWFNRIRSRSPSRLGPARWSNRLLLTDMVMPGDDRTDLAVQLRQRKPGSGDLQRL